MSKHRRLFAMPLCGGLLLACASLAPGQEKQVTIESGGIRITQGPEIQPPGNVAFVGAEMGLSFDGKLVKGAPYSAQAFTETTQTLGDGNRIVNKSSSSVYRDSEGRTRREQSFAVFGPPENGEAPQAIFINDPVVGVSYMLEPDSHVARKMTPMKFEYKFNTDGDKGLSRKNREGLPGGPPEMGPVRIGAREGGGKPGVIMEWHSGAAKNFKTESLGAQTLEGVEAEGTRTTITIPAGEIGNERAIEIVSERWYSPALQTVVMSRHSDPRFGETVYRLTNINRSEPDKSLFQLPADYTIKEATFPPLPMRMRMPHEQ